MGKPDYFDSYPTFAMSRDADGILLLRFRAKDGDGPVAYSPQHHTDWSRAFLDIAEDRENRVVILTGTGDSFIDDYAWDRPTVDPQMWDQIIYEGKHLLRRLLDIEVPVIAAVNGPATVHAELAVMSDIVLASETATFQDKAHVPSGSVPGDGVHIVWQELLGMNRGRYFLLTGQTLSAAEAKQLGVVAEVLAPEKLMDRAYEHARALAALNPLAARYSRVVLTQRYKRLIDEQLPFGLALEALAGLDNVRLRRLAGKSTAL
ncbi:enoyl-CoA hydratase/isomerase family protein [Streptomyces mexicanus]|jgi:enoyl-CoA hydratase/carnithine racemase|uniref:Enoyl-CoA hydratase/isomerase family protein n=1 Tax=Streptomyces mexicanus TaxID=178566 RepID=A0A7X1HXE6_9ACTN|nr:enoyl-CoA hydratase/isomerase family protein [Streptomyces mexicanus]MBC2864949.1 enoyl-CoA hydratase/isomerase family protein [Streptomyces mexicanus]